jgi:chromosome segregation ATPase
LKQRERQRKAAEERAQLEAERKQAAAEKAKLEKERQRVAAELARLQEELQQSALERSRLGQQGSERKTSKEDIGRQTSEHGASDTNAREVRQIFISYIEEEESIAKEIACALEEAGYSVWYYERDSYPGTAYLYQVNRAIERCQVVLALISPESVKSPQVEDEINWARERRKRFVPVLRGMSWNSFEANPPEWRMALGTTAGVMIPERGVSAILPRILKGLELLGIERKVKKEPE